MIGVNVDINRFWQGIFNGLRYEFIYGGHLVSLGVAYVLSVSLLMGMEPLKTASADLIPDAAHRV